MYGATLLGSAAWTSGGHWGVRLVLAAMADVYPNSGGEAGAEAFDAPGGREEFMARARLSATTPPLMDSLRAAIWYEWTTMDSTAPTTTSRLTLYGRSLVELCHRPVGARLQGPPGPQSFALRAGP
jgi:hypothetical protein